MEFNFYSQPTSDEEKRLFIQSFEIALRIAKDESKNIIIKYDVLQENGISYENEVFVGLELE